MHTDRQASLTHIYIYTYIYIYIYIYKSAPLYWTTAAPNESCAHQEDKRSALNPNQCINMYLRQTHFNITFRSTPGSPKYQATSHWGSRINMSQACTILIVSIRATCPSHKVHEDSWPWSPRGTCSSHSRQLRLPIWFHGKHRQFSTVCAEQITIGSPVSTAAQSTRLCKPRNVPSRANISGTSSLR
jgi:hypothetical protein